MSNPLVFPINKSSWDSELEGNDEHRIGCSWFPFRARSGLALLSAHSRTLVKPLPYARQRQFLGIQNQKGQGIKSRAVIIWSKVKKEMLTNKFLHNQGLKTMHICYQDLVPCELPEWGHQVLLWVNWRSPSLPCHLDHFNTASFIKSCELISQPSECVSTVEAGII